MSITDPDHVVSIESRHDKPGEIAELREFVAAAAAEDLDYFVERAFYDSASCTCYFEFRMGLVEDEDAAHQLKEIASRTISQFEWFGINCLGRGLEDE